MDKQITLNTEELDRLREFIRKKGFSDPIVVEEILDHFACKVEERLTAEPGLDLEQVMKRAHHDFGIKGFRPVVEVFEQELRKKYNRLYWRSIKQNLFSMKFMLIMIMGAWLFCQYCVWSVSTGRLENIAFGLLVAFALLEFLAGLFTHRWRNLRRNYFLRHSIKTSGVLMPWIVWMTLINGPKNPAASGGFPYFVVVMAIAVFVYLLLHSIARYHTQKAAVEEFELFRERMGKR